MPESSGASGAANDATVDAVERETADRARAKREAAVDYYKRELDGAKERDARAEARDSERAAKVEAKAAERKAEIERLTAALDAAVKENK